MIDATTYELTTNQLKADEWFEIVNADFKNALNNYSAGLH